MIGKILRDARGDMPLREAAELFGMSHVHLCNIENGKAVPSWHLMRLICIMWKDRITNHPDFKRIFDVPNHEA